MITYVPSVVKVYQTPIKRVAVLISGTGTNLQVSMGFVLIVLSRTKSIYYLV